jgi:hypothetical protein
VLPVSICVSLNRCSWRCSANNDVVVGVGVGLEGCGGPSGVGGGFRTSMTEKANANILVVKFCRAMFLR